MQSINDLITGMDVNSSWSVKKIKDKKTKQTIDKPTKK